MQRHISYLSDPGGKLVVSSKCKLDVQKQGSDQAEFLTCPMCHDVITASIPYGDKRIGALNTNLLDEYHKLKSPTVVSPKALSAEDKLARWQTVWTPVFITTESNFSKTGGALSILL